MPELWIVPGKVAHGIEGESKFVNSFSTELYANIIICNLNIASYTYLVLSFLWSKSI